MKKQICFLTLVLMLAASCYAQIKLAVLEPEGKGLSNDEVWMLSLVQSSIAADFNKYSHIKIIDRQNLEAIIAEQKRSLSDITSDEDAIKIGHLANANHILTGKITKTPNAFMLELAVTDVKTGERKASHSPQAVTPSSLENLSALKEASADLLKQLGVSLTDSQLAELRGPVASAQVQAQTALAHGVVAERQGTSVAALSYFYQAAAFDPTLVEAVKRSSVMSANISGINIGDNIRNDIVWRKKWVEQLKETEETFYKIINSTPPPYTLYYSTVIETGKIDYQKETADLNISLNRLASAEWFNAMQRSLNAAQAVMRGLNATNRKKDWGLDNWPKDGVSDTNPFGFGYSYYSKNYDMTVEFELVNQQGRVIGKATAPAELNPSINIDWNFVVRFNKNLSYTLIFREVNANDISDKLIIRLASVNGKPPKTAKFPIIAVSNKEFPEYRVQTKRTTFTDSRDGKKYKAVEIGAQTWMAENLNYNASGSKCYDNKPANCQKYGRLYDWNTAMKVCPQSWHLPTWAEWDILTVSDRGERTAGKLLMATSGWNKDKVNNGTDDFGFSALPGGFCGSEEGSFRAVGNLGSWWSAYKDDIYYAYGRYGDDYYEGRYMDDYDKGSLRSVRCVQD